VQGIEIFAKVLRGVVVAVEEWDCRVGHGGLRETGFRIKRDARWEWRRP
jgi:hypothetical protein